MSRITGCGTPSRQRAAKIQRRAKDGNAFLKSKNTAGRTPEAHRREAQHRAFGFVNVVWPTAVVAASDAILSFSASAYTFGGVSDSVRGRVSETSQLNCATSAWGISLGRKAMTLKLVSGGSSFASYITNRMASHTTGATAAAHERHAA